MKYDFKTLAEQYKRNVLDYFREEYRAGRTPNPCVKCNQKMKFGFLIDCAHKLLDFDTFATGHYAQVSDNGRLLRKAVDSTKDQTYFLSRLKREQLSSENKKKKKSKPSLRNPDLKTLPPSTKVKTSSNAKITQFSSTRMTSSPVTSSI